MLNSSPHRRWCILRPKSDETESLNLGPRFFLSLAIFWSVPRTLALGNLARKAKRLSFRVGFRREPVLAAVRCISHTLGDPGWLTSRLALVEMPGALISDPFREFASPMTGCLFPEILDADTSLGCHHHRRCRHRWLRRSR